MVRKYCIGTVEVDRLFRLIKDMLAVSVCKVVLCTQPAFQRLFTVETTSWFMVESLLNYVLIFNSVEVSLLLPKSFI